EGVAAKAGVGKTTIYRWWSTKADIYIDLYSELALQIVPPPDTGDYVRDLVILVQGAFKLYRNTAAGPALAGIIAEAQSNAAISAAGSRCAGHRCIERSRRPTRASAGARRSCGGARRASEGPH